MGLTEFEKIVKKVCREDGGIATYEIDQICEDKGHGRYLLNELVNKGRIIHHSDGVYTTGLSAHKAKTSTVPMDADSIGNLGPMANTGQYRILQGLAGLLHK